MLEPSGSDRTVAKDKYFTTGQAAQAMSDGATSAPALMGYERQSAERSSAYGGLGRVSYVYIYRALPTTWSIVLNLPYYLLYAIDLLY